MPIKKMHELNLNNKRVLIREDLNVPIQAGKITNGAARLHAVLPTIKQALAAGAAVILLSHLGRPKEGQFDANLSLAPVAERLATLLEMPVRFEPEWLNGVAIQPGEVVLCENVRFNVGEKNNDEALAKKIAALCDVFIMDAFGTGHRAHASTSGAAQFAPIACAGPLLTAELETLEKVLAAPAKPMIAIVAGSKVSTKLTLLKNLFGKIDELIVGGGIANTLIAASGYDVGKSLYEAELIPEAKNLIQQAKQQNVNIPIPKDVIVAKALSPTATAEVKLLTEIQDDDLILDIGPETARDYAEKLKQAGTIVWNGPVGVFELEQFSEGTKTLAGAIAASEAFSIAGGGDTLAAIEKYEVADKISYISTGGGAFLEFLEGKTFPVIEILKKQS